MGVRVSHLAPKFNHSGDNLGWFFCMKIRTMVFNLHSLFSLPIIVNSFPSGILIMNYQRTNSRVKATSH
jgi:hypothetical protein